MTIVDSTVWIDFFDGVQTPHTNWLVQAIPKRRVGLTDFIFCEVLQGFRSDKAFLQAESALSRFSIFDTGGADLALASAQNYRLLRKRGLAVRKTIDCLIATFCLREGHSLLHNDRDFDVFEEHLGLEVINPEQPPFSAVSFPKRS